MFADIRKLKQFKAEKMTKVGLVDSPRMFCDLYCLLPGQEQRVHAHADSDKVYYVLEGAPTIVIGDEERRLAPGGIAHAAPGIRHGVRNDSDTGAVCLVFMTPGP